MLGPFRGGRVDAVSGVPGRPNEFYFGSVNGGVWKSIDAGRVWTPIFDSQPVASIGALAVAPSAPDTIYVGSGESTLRDSMGYGNGVYKSTDAGKTWTHLGLDDTQHIGKIAVDPRNPNVVFVAAIGHLYAPNADRGVFKSIDGGKTWRKVLFRNDSTGVSDMAMDPNDPNTLYAAMWQAGRKPWLLVSGGAGSGIFKTTDGGEHWTELTHNPGLPKGIIGDIGITVSPADPQRVYAIVESDSGGVFRSDDGGATWTRTNQERKLRQRAWYYSRIFADPKDSNTVYVVNVSFFRSTDGGKTFNPIAVPHGDNHDLWIAPNDPKRMIESNDGGATVTFDGGKAWSDEDYATAQFYHVTTTTDFPYKVCGAQQDNSTLCGPSRWPGGIPISEWQEVGGGESGYIQVRPDSTNIVYAGSYAYLSRMDLSNGQRRDIIPWPDNPMGHSAEDLKYRFQWTFPILISPHDPNTLYLGSQVLFRTHNGGQSWEIASPDLTRHDPATLGPSGGPITKDQTSVEYYATIFAIAESPVVKGVIWTGSDDGLIYVTRDNGKTWSNVTPKDLPPFTRISIIDASHFGAGTAYVAANRYQLDDDAPYLYKTSDYGKTWTRIDAGIDRTQFTRTIREDPERRGLLYVGTERGVWVSFDDGSHWQSLQRNLPKVPVHDLEVTQGDLVAATHGRSFYILDDVSALRQLTPEIAQAPMHLFKPRAAYRVNWGGGFGGGGGREHPVGKNPPNGAVVYYTLSSPNQKVTLDFLDAKGAVIQSFSSQLDSAGLADSVRADSIKKANKGKEPAAEGGFRRPTRPRVSNTAGLNMFAWDLRYPDAVGFTNLIMWAGSTRGPIAVPGTYSVRLTVNGKSQTQSFVLKKDPRVHATQADFEAQFALLMKVRDRLSAADNAVRTIRNLEWQMDQHGSSAPSGFADAAGALKTKLDTIEAAIYQVHNRASEDPLNFPIRLNNKIAALGGSIASADARPTAQDYAVYTLLSGQLDHELAELKTTLASGLPPLNAMLRGAGQKELVPSTSEPPQKEVAEVE